MKPDPSCRASRSGGQDSKKDVSILKSWLRTNGAWLSQKTQGIGLFMASVAPKTPYSAVSHVEKVEPLPELTPLSLWLTSRPAEAKRHLYGSDLNQYSKKPPGQLLYCFACSAVGSVLCPEGVCALRSGKEHISPDFCVSRRVWSFDLAAVIAGHVYTTTIGPTSIAPDMTIYSPFFAFCLFSETDALVCCASGAGCSPESFFSSLIWTPTFRPTQD